LRGLSELKDDLSLDLITRTVTFLAEVDEFSSDGTYEADFLISGFIPASGAGDYDVKYTNASLALSFRLEDSASTKNLNVTDVQVGIGFQKMITYLQNFRVGGSLVDWSDEASQFQVQALVSDILDSQLEEISARMQITLNWLLQVRNN
jgi:hypothetical protein